jgi:hypothetical protein
VVAYLEDPNSPMRGIFVEFLAVVEGVPERVVEPEKSICFFCQRLLLAISKWKCKQMLMVLKPSVRRNDYGHLPYRQNRCNDERSRASVHQFISIASV